MEMHCKVCSPIWNTKNLIYKKKIKKNYKHFIPFPLISAIYLKTSPRCLQTSAWRFSEGRKIPASDMYSSVLLLYSFICEGESNYNVNYSLEQRKYLSSPTTKNDLGRLCDFYCDTTRSHKNFAKIVITEHTCRNLFSL